MGSSSAPVFPFPGGTPGTEPVDPVAGKPGHFAWSKWIKEFVKRLDRESVKISGDTMTGPLTLKNGTSSVQLSNDGIALKVGGPVATVAPSASNHAATKQYVDSRIPPYYEGTFTSDASGWAPLIGLKAGAVITSMLDVSTTPTTTPIRLSPSTNTVYLGPNTARKLRIWYV